MSPREDTDAPVELCREGTLSIRRMRNEHEDLALLTEWRGQPHVHEWWDPDSSSPGFDQVAEKYGARTHPSSPTTPCIIEVGDRPIGYIQFYRWSSYASEADEMQVPFDDDSFGLDVLIGEPGMVGRGHGSQAVSLLCRYLAAEHGATGVLLLTEIGNVRAQRAYERAGFLKVKEVLDLDTRDGERTRCWLMRWDAPVRAA